MTIKEFNDCVDQYADALYRFILKNTRDEEVAKDIIQDTYEKLWLKVSDVPATNAKSYMFTTAYRTMVDKIRRDRKLSFLDEGALPVHSHSFQYSDLKATLNKALARLPEVQRSAVMLRDYEGYNYAEIGQIMGLNESQVKVYIFRARKTLKEYLGQLENLVG